MKLITSNYQPAQTSVQETLGLLDDQLAEFVANYWDEPKWGRAKLAAQFALFGQTVLNGWRSETNSPLDEHTTFVLRTLADKQFCYGPENVTRHFGMRGILVRINDKIARLQNLYRRGVRNALFETIEDTWLDLLGYTVIALMLIDDTFTLPLERDLPQ